MPKKFWKYSKFSLGQFPGIWFIIADVSEPSIRSIFIGWSVKTSHFTFTLQPMKMDPTEGSKTSAIINQTPGNYPKEYLLYSVHGESLKWRIQFWKLTGWLFTDMYITLQKLEVKPEEEVDADYNCPASINRFTFLISGNIRVCVVIERVSCC